MERIEKEVGRLQGVIGKIAGRKGPFLALFLIVFFASFIVLTGLDLVPESKTVGLVSPLVASTSAPVLSSSVPQSPVHIQIESIGLSASVGNPTTTDIGVLDAALLSGAVRYPTSARLGEEKGNVVIFGHSSYLPIVNNPAYKTFDGIQKLKAGDTIVVSSTNRAYTYAVRMVEKVHAEDGAIPLSVTGRVLTLSTCDSFGTKSDRFVVTADFVKSEVIPT